MEIRNSGHSLAGLQQLQALLKLEYNYEKELYQSRTQQMGIERRIRQGICWYPVHTGNDRYNSLNQLTLEINRLQEDETEPLFEYGRPVCFFQSAPDGSLRYFNFSATISYIRENQLVVVLPGVSTLNALRLAGDLGVQLFFDDTSYRTMFAALEDVIKADGDRTARLREVLLGNLLPQQRPFSPLRLPWLNASQEKAVNQVLQAKDVAVVHGPPGTGKTTTLVEAIYETLHRETQVLVCAQSNTAVDWISEKLVDRGIQVLRIGNPTRVNDKMLSFTYEKRFEAHPWYPELWNLRKAIREAGSRMRQADRADRAKLREQTDHLRDRAAELENRIDSQLFDEARVIACTLVGTANRLLVRKRFSTLFIDEAAQALEPACWIAIRRADRVILAGDPCQLAPTVKCMEAAKGGLEQTLLQKVIRRKPETVTLLNVQYRMHEEIMRFSSEWFYDGKLQAAPEVSHRNILEYDLPVEWIDTTGEGATEKGIAEGAGRLNVQEAKLLLQQLRIYIEKIGGRRLLEENIDIGVISPYRAQVQYLRALLRRESFFRPFRRIITVHTVDGFQGQERDVIFISLVRSNMAGQIGFLRELRRMNVAMTRARMKLVILGDRTTLTKHPFYCRLYEYIQELKEKNIKEPFQKGDAGRKITPAGSAGHPCGE